MFESPRIGFEISKCELKESQQLLPQLLLPGVVEEVCSRDSLY